MTKAKIGRVKKKPVRKRKKLVKRTLYAYSRVRNLDTLIGIDGRLDQCVKITGTAALGVLMVYDSLESLYYDHGPGAQYIKLETDEPEDSEQ